MSSRKNFRRRPQASDGEETTTTTTTTAPKPSSNLKKLSFVEDEEDEQSLSRPPSCSKSHQTKSSSSSRHTKTTLSSSFSHKISTKDRLTTTSTTSSSTPSNVQPQAGEYTKEKLRELQKNTRTIASSSRHPPPSSLEPTFLLKGIVKPLENPRNNQFEQLDGEEKGLLSKKDEDVARDAGDRFAAVGIGKSKDEFPDRVAIAEIKAKRERLRKTTTAAPDYISLDGGSNHGAADGLSNEEPEFRNRIQLVGDEKEIGRKGVFENVEVSKVHVDSRDVGLGNDEEVEEDEMWIAEQVRKGLGKRSGDGSITVSSSVGDNNQSVQGYSYQPTPAPSVPISQTIGGSVGISRSAEAMSISQQAEVATKVLQDNIKRLKEYHGRTISSMTNTDENLSASLSNLTALEMSLSSAGEKFEFLQKIRDFISTICDFLQHKDPLIEELEDKMKGFQKDRALATVNRRKDDDADEMPEIEVAVDAAKSLFAKGGSGAAAAQATAREQNNLPVQLDEFGRDVNLQKNMEMMQKAEGRKRRKAKSESKRMLSVSGPNTLHHIEGESSTDESDSECTSYRSQRSLVLETAEQIFSDASEEYSELSLVKERFETWKKHYASAYRDAYVSLSAPVIFSYYVRLELLKWDPLYEEADFNNMQWHILLFNYGLLETECDFVPGDADADLVPGLVEMVALPILHHQIAHCWDVFSPRITKNAVSATNLVISYVPVSSKALRELLIVIHTCLATAINNLNVPTWTSTVTNVVPNAARAAAYRFGMSIRLLRNICLWKDILALSVLEQLALDKLLVGKVLPHVRGMIGNIHDTMIKTERIVASLYGVWAGPSATAEHGHKLQPLVDFVLTLGKTLEKKHMSGVSQSETSGLARRLKKMLVDLNEYDKARTVSRTFQLKESL